MRNDTTWRQIVHHYSASLRTPPPSLEDTISADSLSVWVSVPNRPSGDGPAGSLFRCMDMDGEFGKETSRSAKASGIDGLGLESS